MPLKSKRDQNNQSSQHIDSSNVEISSQNEQENGKDCPLSESSLKLILGRGYTMTLRQIYRSVVICIRSAKRSGP
jgi:hypothetical protein